MRLENAEDRLSERMFRAAMGAGASSTVAHGVRHAYDGVVRWLRTVPAEERRGHVADLTAAFRRTLS